MDVSIIIVNYNTCSLTSNCIDSIIKYTKDVEYEIILVDNASTDGSKQKFENDSRLKYIFLENNLGFGRANNIGFLHSTGEYVFLLNSDTLLLNNAVYLFWKISKDADSSVACLGAQLLDINKKPAHSFSDFPSLKTTARTLFYLAKRSFPEIVPPTSYPLKVDYITGADLFIRRSVIEECGMFSPDFFMYFEETEMQYRYAQKGYYSMVVSGPQIIHLEGASVNIGTHKYKGSRRVFFFTSMFLFMRKRYGRLKYYIFRGMAMFFIPFIVRKDNTKDDNVRLIKLFICGR